MLNFGGESLQFKKKYGSLDRIDEIIRILAGGGSKVSMCGSGSEMSLYLVFVSFLCSKFLIP